MSRLLPLLAVSLLIAAIEPALAENALPLPADDLRALQGDWKVTSAIGGPKTLLGETPQIIQTLGDDRLIFQIKENQLSFQCIRTVPGETLVLANDLPLPKQTEQLQSSIKGDRLIMLTLNSGKGLLASYNVSGDQLTLRYPAGCCSRSGNVISYERVK